MKDLKAVTRKLLAYCHANDWAGYDPYDALNSPIFKLLPFLDFRIPRLVLTQVLKRSPVNFRPLLLVPKTHNPKAIALFLVAFLKLSKLGLLEHKDLIPKMADKLMALRSPGIPYWCWGYSFPWQTQTLLVPRGAPNLVCTTFVANALLDAYEANLGSDYLEMAFSAAEYILNELYWTGNDDVVSFAYPTPSSHTSVHNANFLGAALLCRIYNLSGEKKFLESALTVARYSAAKQHRDGSWDYGESANQHWVDNFHTGYNLCALRSIGRNAGTAEFDTTIERGFRYYRDQFFLGDGAPKYFHDRIYPLDIHSAAQSIITLLTFKYLDNAAATTAHAVFWWAMRHMWNPQGYFYYRKYPFFVNRISYMRWSQAWILLALATLLEACQERSKRT